MLRARGRVGILNRNSGGLNPFANTVIYSTRLVNPNYTGYCLRLSDNSGNHTDVPFVDGLMDQPTAQTAIDAGQTQVSIWYDQSGHGYDAAQATYAKMPTLTLDGTPSHMPTLTFVPTQYMDIPLAAGLSAMWKGGGYRGIGMRFNSGGTTGKFIVAYQDRGAYFTFPVAVGATAHMALGIQYNSSDYASQPIVTIDGVGQTVTTNTLPLGLLANDATKQSRIGAQIDGTAGLDGDIWEMQIFKGVP